MRSFLTIAAFLSLPFYSLAQAVLPLQDNWLLPSDTSIKLIDSTYSFQDTDLNGIIRIIGKQNITIDGDSVTVDGLNQTGYMIYVENSNNITIKNFSSVLNYYYAVYIKNSAQISIQNCTFSYNKIDSIGWITIFDGADSALGGGVFMDSCRDSEIFDNNMQFQNDGVALYKEHRIWYSNVPFRLL